MAWLTPFEDAQGGYDSRPLYIPRPFTPIITGLLYKLIDWWNWEEFGDITRDEAIATMQAMIDTYLEGNQMIGVCFPYATADVPSNMLLCDGSAYARADYPALYAVLAAAYIDDEETFHVPDYVGKVPRGTSGAQAVLEGADTHTLIVDEMPPHDHEIPYESCFPYGATPEVCVVGGVLTQRTGSTGGGEPHNNMQASFGQPWGIVYR